MSLVLLQNATAMAKNLTLPFAGSGGTPAYTYSVVAGGVGGTINASTGIYTSPDAFGKDTIQVTDSVMATATATIFVGSALELVCDIIQQGMALTSDQIYLWDQKVNIPTDSRLYVAVGIVSCKPFGNTNRNDGSGSGLDAIQSVNMSSLLDINILSRGPDARNRKEEVILALNSTYAEQQQELNSFRVFPITNNFINLSQIDGAAIPYRFNISVSLQYFVSKTVVIDYFDDFSEASVVTDP